MEKSIFFKNLQNITIFKVEIPSGVINIAILILVEFPFNIYVEFE
jgi:hypothetical protein